jgi:hypothetical protein
MDADTRQPPMKKGRSVAPEPPEASGDTSPRDRRLKKWARDIWPDDGELLPLPFERPGASREAVQRAHTGLQCFGGLGLTDAALARLVAEIRRERTVRLRERRWPTLADDKAGLERIVHYAKSLSNELAEMSMRVEIALNSEYHDANEARAAKARAEGDHADTDELDHARMQEYQLPALIEAATQVLKRMPYQARPLAQVHLVKVVAEAVKPLGIRPSKSPTSRFHLACQAAFDIADVQFQAAGKRRPSRPSPTGSIRAFMAKRGRYSWFSW